MLRSNQILLVNGSFNQIYVILLIYLFTYLVTYLLSYLLTDWLTHLLTYLLTYLLTKFHCFTSFSNCSVASNMLFLLSIKISINLLISSVFKGRVSLSLDLVLSMNLFKTVLTIFQNSYLLITTSICFVLYFCCIKHIFQ